MSWDFIWYWLLPRLGLVLVSLIACSILFVLWVMLDNRRDAHKRARQALQHDAHTAPYLPRPIDRQPTPETDIDWDALKREVMQEVDRLFREANKREER